MIAQFEHHFRLQSIWFKKEESILDLRITMYDLGIKNYELRFFCAAVKGNYTNTISCPSGFTDGEEY
ncbi:MAG: hypothetical protein D8M57_11690 [Candidatus Scalindua sp. AMX11]|nr:MAG: hypothetical protein DWQ00_18000 [Candidatus Scalindua sp.]TDE64757.1 MAG: hypothetical protein D8M57_11690 [Candidatus Scalindua sp. AMX11]GJQ58678.1 MAG: hypothetical protein SCALA701_14790 [Candidatus Scalindua sp.]